MSNNSKTSVSFEELDSVVQDGFLELNLRIRIKGQFPQCFARLAKDCIIDEFDRVFLDFRKTYLPGSFSSYWLSKRGASVSSDPEEVQE